MSRRFTENELKVITINALPFVGQWLMSGAGVLKDTQIYRESSDLATELESIRLIIKLRILLAQAEQLCVLFKKIDKRASSHRVMKRVNIVGVVRGRLDIPTYINHRHERKLPKEYPCIIVERELDTPENILLCMTLIEFVRDVTKTTKLINKIWSSSPKPVEIYLAENQVNKINRLIASVTWSKPTNKARRLLQNYGFYPAFLYQNAKNRLAKKRMRDPSLYKEFLTWVSLYKDSWAPGLIDEASLVRLLSYDSTAWHDRLFELYGTWKLAEALSDCMGTTPLQQQVNLLGKHTKGPVFTFELPQSGSSLRINLYFQKAAGVLWDNQHPPNINYLSENDLNKTIKGIPDAIFQCQFDGKAVYLIVDFKNRFQWSQEHFVMVGYFHNFKAKMPSPYGYLIFRTRKAQSNSILVTNPGKLGVCYAGPSHDSEVNQLPYNSVIEMLKEACRSELGAVFP